MSFFRLRGFLIELRRRKVVRVAVAYAIGAWLVVQVAATTMPLIGAPEWVGRVVLLLAALGFPLALGLSWAYDATPHGIVRAQALALELPGAVTAPPAPAVSPRRIAPPPRSVAVLPFSDMSAEGDQEHFSDGMAEEILNMLARLRDIRVAARTSSFAFKGRSADVRRIGEELGVASVVEGSVRKAGDQVRITVQLIDVSNGYHLWSERYDRRLHDVFAIQDEIARNIAGALDAKLAPAAEPQRPPTADVRAYDLYLRARQLFHQMRRGPMLDARETFHAAVAVDPRFARAYAGAAICSCMLHMYWDHAPENLESADRDSLRALELAPRQAEAHSARGLALSVARRYGDAEAEFEEALRLDDTQFDTHYFYARSCWAAGKLEEAARLFTLAAQLRPEDFQALSLLQSVYAALGRPDDERSAALQAFERTNRHLELNPEDVRALYLGAGQLVCMGQPERAREWAARAIALDPDDCATRYNVACVYGRLGDTDGAVTQLEAAVRLGFAHRAWIENDGDFTRVRHDPRFSGILAGLT